MALSQSDVQIDSSGCWLADTERLATAPLAHVCHNSRLFSAYNETAYAALKETFIDAGAQTLGMVCISPLSLKIEPQPVT